MNLLYRYFNGNHYTSIYDDGTRIRETIDPNDNKFTYDFAESVDVLITKRCDANCPYCHESASKNGKHGDLNLPIFDSWKSGTEVAIGGGNIFEHPDLTAFLNKMKSKQVICNITVNQIHIDKNFDILTYLIKNELIRGLGISINPNLDFTCIDKLHKLSNNIVYHTIAGVLDFSYIPKLTNRKVLILGYKDNLGRGYEYNKKNSNVIKEKISWLKSILPDLKNKIKVLSFDNLALAQLDIKNTLKVDDDEWNLRFQGKDYGEVNDNNPPSTFYLDTVNLRIGRSSTQPYRERVIYINQSFEEAYRDSMKNYSINRNIYGELKK